MASRREVGARRRDPHRPCPPSPDVAAPIPVSAASNAGGEPPAVGVAAGTRHGVHVALASSWRTKR